ncbi:MAG TPA: hypothetical protein VM533_08265 [Fimbriiglobus sp.]|jgi:hypothetical protein|nr:hypothetical protein [Fimbriiglobus sp.]
METFQVLNGVRRAKAAESVGHTNISAAILDQDGRLVEVRLLPLDSLLSPKGILDLRSSAVALIRFRRLQSLLLAGVSLDPIEVMPGNHGTPLAAVQVLT